LVEKTGKKGSVGLSIDNKSSGAVWQKEKKKKKV